MKKFFIYFILISFFTSSLKAQIAYIDMNLVLNKSEVGKYLNSHIEKIKNKNIEKFKEIEKNLIDKEKLLISQQNILDNNEFDKKLAILKIEVNKYKSDKKLYVDQLNKIKIESTKEILKVLNPIITKYVDLNSISLVIPKKNIIIGKKNLDITDQIIKQLDQNLKKLNF
tara:strand:- start:31 stop:540 length:510 start_codon:yes stop_codon:yes gene_type:complete